LSEHSSVNSILSSLNISSKITPLAGSKAVSQKVSGSELDLPTRTIEGVGHQHMFGDKLIQTVRYTCTADNLNKLGFSASNLTFNVVEIAGSQALVGPYTLRTVPAMTTIPGADFRRPNFIRSFL
jgi:hypothetical protein